VRVPREKASARGSRFSPFFGSQVKTLLYRFFLSCPLRNKIRFRLGEGRIRSLLYGLPMSWILLLFMSAIVPDLAAGERLLIKLKEDVSVDSSTVCLKDVADLRGPDERQVEKLAHTVIAGAPVFGETAVFSRHQVRELVQAAAGPLPADAFVGANAVRIRAAGRQLTPDEIFPILKSHILQTTAWKESEISIRSIGNLGGIELPLSGAEFRIPTGDAVVGSRTILAPLEILQDGKKLRSYWITGDIDIRAEVLAAARRIIPGREVTADDVEKRVVEIPDMRTAYARNPEEVLGKVARRGLLAGAPLTRESFADPLLVRSGEIVRIRLERDGITLTSLAKAQQDGVLGQFIRVRSVDFPAFMKAKVTGRLEVKMQ